MRLAFEETAVRIANLLGWLNWVDPDVVRDYLHKRAAVERQSPVPVPNANESRRNPTTENQGRSTSETENTGLLASSTDAPPGIPFSISRRGISVVLPTYNEAHSLVAVLQSIFAQTRVPDEIIIVDDCSTDNALQVVRRFRDPHNRIKLLSTSKKSGYAAASNVGIRAASYDFIALSQANDLWLPRHCFTLAALLESCPDAALAFSRPEVSGLPPWIRPLFITTLNQPVWCFWNCFRTNGFVRGLNVMVRREALLEIGGYRSDLKMRQDFDLYLRLSYKHQFICSNLITTHFQPWDIRDFATDAFASLSEQYLSRQLFWIDNQSSMDPHVRERLEATMRDVWIANVRDAWDRNDLPLFLFHLAQHALVPASQPLHKAWMRRKHLFALKRWWASVYRHASIRRDRSLPDLADF
jgi:glycosyltransferase involved in cell wall biosynthesis